MDAKLSALSTSIANLDALRKAISKNEALENSQALAAKLNAFAGSLGALFEAGRDMDQSSLLEIPSDMLSFLDGETSNPELYYYHAIEDAEAQCTRLQSRLVHLQTLKDRVSLAVAPVQTIGVGAQVVKNEAKGAN